MSTRNEKFITIGQTTAVVAHELRNPLGTIRNSIHVLKHLDFGPEAEAHLERCERSIMRCDKIIEELLDYTRDVKHKSEWFLIRDVIENVLKILQPGKSTEIRTDIRETPILLGVPTKVERALINIIQNAIDVININKIEGKIHIRVKQVKDRVWIFVANEGPNIDEIKIDKIFEPLYSTKGFGVGLGLPIARKIFEEHGGTLIAKNIEDGVVFMGCLAVGGNINV